MSRVYVIQSTRYQADVSPAQVYGTIEFVLGPSDRTSSSPEISLSRLREGLRNFDPRQDYILWSGGDPLSCMLTGWILSEMGVDSFRYLRYEKADPRKVGSSPFYVPVSITPTER